ncbi:MAG: hypothetical protein Q4C42_06485 [Clostridia bacterium]|nr:hypothetical protein [Clostridia bacterium]
MLLALSRGGSYTYNCTADDKQIIIYGVAETKGGKHLKYRNIKKIVFNKEKCRIDIHSIITKTSVFTEEEDFETVRNFIAERCDRAKIIE